MPILKQVAWVVVIAASLISAPRTVVAKEKAAKEVTIGISVGDLRLERWKKDVDFMKQAAAKIGAKTYATSADGDENKQISQIENMLTKGIDVLVVIPVGSGVMAPVVDAAHMDHVKVIAYDRLIENCDLDYYITFDMLGVGKLQAQYLLEKVPKGRYYLLAGDKEDNNARLFREGQMMVLKPKIDDGSVQVVGDQWAGGWLPENAMKLTENVLTATNNRIDAILASNDSTAQGAIQALKEQNLAGKIPITGQDADLASCQAIVAGEQTMTVYKPLPKLATAAVELAVKIARGENVATNATYPNGKKQVPAINLGIIAVDKANILQTVISDGFHSYDEVYKNVPAAQRPPKPSN